MGASRVVLAVLALSSIHARPARSQAAPSDAPAAPEARREPDELDDERAAGSGSARPLVAPADPRARVQWLKDRVAQVIAGEPRLGRARIAVSAVDLATGNELIAHDADRAMSLASAAKLLTSVAALATLGGGFRWRTSVFGAEPDDKGVIAGDLYVRGRGDPTLGVEDLRALAADVAARGVRDVDRLVVDAGYFDDVVEPPHFDDQKTETAGFRAPVASFGVARSTVTVTVVADPGGGATVTLDPDPGHDPAHDPGDYLKLVNKGVTSVTRGRTRLQVDIRPRHDHLEIEVAGQIRWGEGSWDVKKRVADPLRFAGEVFRRALVERGVRVRSRSLGRGVVPPQAKLLAAHDSAPLSELVRHMNKVSDNYVAESVLKTLGAETRSTPGPATWDDGRAALHAYLAKIGMPPAGYRADNGSGLFDATEVSARQVTTVLRAAHKDYRVGPDLVASLPVGGVDGTLARRWHGHPALGRVRAKTGTLDKVTTLAGYLAIDGQHPVGFAVLVNDIPPGQRASARTTADEIIDALVAYLASPAAPAVPATPAAPQGAP
ncbi:MAG TPA: D-alanyl-D-alanine carboxypeptidase/D-alanyl-D-alanine-endopeptidase [Kofleriaceae bacterium]|nr:D-alanyl-D-alanine carboxypeptidase/D-alanyl-D-alanine-endopeptidase [Kofleriaceae bacterium]